MSRASSSLQLHRDRQSAGIDPPDIVGQRRTQRMLTRFTATNRTTSILPAWCALFVQLPVARRRSFQDILCRSKGCAVELSSGSALAHSLALVGLSGVVERHRVLDVAGA